MGDETIEAAMRKRQVLFAGFVVHLEGTRLPNFWGGAGILCAQENEMDEVSCKRSLSLERGKMAQKS